MKGWMLMSFVVLRSDYTAIDPRYGTLEDWDRLLAGVHERGMKLLYVLPPSHRSISMSNQIVSYIWCRCRMDLVANHTSDEVRLSPPPPPPPPPPPLPPSPLKYTFPHSPRSLPHDPQHEWFKESSSSPTNPKRDWYIWRPPRYDPTTGEMKPPNNWKSIFQGAYSAS